MRRPLLLLVAGALAATGIVAWRAWPRDPGPVAPPLTSSQLRFAARQIQARVTPVGNRSRLEAHRLREHWYRTLGRRDPDGEPPRNVHISLVQVSDAEISVGTDDYWVVYADNMYMPSFGPGGGGGRGPEIDLYEPGSLQLAWIMNG